MDHCTWKRVSWQISSIRNSLGQQQGLPFVDLLTPDMLRDMAGPEAESSEPIYTQLVTLWMFLGQVVDSDPSCRQAVARLLAWLTLKDNRPAVRKRGRIARHECDSRKTIFTVSSSLREQSCMEKPRTNGFGKGVV